MVSSLTTATAIDSATDLALATINNNTLDEIVFSFGGDEEVEDAAVLILNKKDLKAFSRLRTTDGKKFHDIKTNGNTGTIDGIPFIINSACNALTDAGTPDDAYCMAYGPLSNYMLAIFSDLEIKRSEDYKFKQGMIAHRGSVFVGGNVRFQERFPPHQEDYFFGLNLIGYDCPCHKAGVVPFIRRCFREVPC